MRRAVLAPSGALILVACNALTGASDLGVCEGSECSGSPGEEGGADSGTAGDTSINLPDGALPPTCTDGQKACEGKVAANCVGGAWNKSAPCAETCIDGACVAWPSCRGSAGTACPNNTSCCASKPVPGGTFNRRGTAQYPATVSAFSLDVYEVTVGRFRAFVSANAGTKISPPAVGSGAHPKISGSGWQLAWNQYLPADANALKSSLGGGTWTTTPGANETKPITNVRWFVAYAFCVWDGGRLPTYAEANFAAAGGNEQRVYPWSSPASSTTITNTHAAYSCGLDGTPYQCPASYCNANSASPCDATACAAIAGSCVYPACFGCDASKDIASVGQLTKGVGKFGHFDLAGNADELLLDAAPAKNVDDALTAVCLDCAPLMGADPNNNSGNKNEFRVFVASGGWRDGTTELRTNRVVLNKWDDTGDQIGFRCARD